MIGVEPTATHRWESDAAPILKVGPPGHLGRLTLRRETSMSLRPEISGFSLDTMFALLGCGDDALASQLVEEFDASVSFQDPTLRDRAHAILRRAVHERPRWADLDVEDELHVFAALTLAKHGQTHLQTGSHVWKMPTFWDFILQNHEQIPKPGRKYLSTFTKGRGVFARNIKTEWSFYGYLARPELQELLAATREFQAEPAHRGPEFMHGFADELVEWLGMIESNEKDLWFFCY